MNTEIKNVFLDSKYGVYCFILQSAQFSESINIVPCDSSIFEYLKKYY